MALTQENTDEALFSMQPRSHQELVSYVMSYVEEWKQYRDTNYQKDWDFYYRMWRGIYSSEDKSRDSERSRLISPALQQAIEIQVSEMEEATFNKKNWFDISDDVMDRDRAEMEYLRDKLREDMELAKIPGKISETYLLGGLFGNGIGKIVVDEVPEYKVDPQTGEPTGKKVIQVRLEAIDPNEFVIDPAATTVDEALGCAHDTVKPRHEVEKKKKDGIYFDKEIGSFHDVVLRLRSGESRDSDVGDKTRITEWHGLVPKYLIDEVELDLQEDEILEELDVNRSESKDDMYEEELVESIVTIANGSVLLKAIANPFFFKDRSIIAYQHDRVPNRFWGRGVAEKGATSQRALDAELRARIDGMAMTIHPMMGVDASRLPRGLAPSIGPGKVISTNGNPKDILMPFNFGQMNPNTFTQGGELERMLTMATGSMDTQTSIGSNPRNNTASGMSMMTSSMIKRTKRTMQNVDRDFLGPLVRKVAWRYMQFDNERYPIDDYLFEPRSSMGMMAREFEIAQLTQLLQTTDPSSPAHGLILAQIIDNSSGENKEKLKEAIQSMYNQKPDPLVQEARRLEVEKLKEEINKLRSETSENQVDAQVKPYDSKTKRLQVAGTIQDKELDRRSQERIGRQSAGENK